MGELTSFVLSICVTFSSWCLYEGIFGNDTVFFVIGLACYPVCLIYLAKEAYIDACKELKEKNGQ